MNAHQRTGKKPGTAVVTGASAGIGTVYAERLAARGYDLIVAARDQARLEALAKRLRETAGVRVEVIRSDLTVLADVEKLAERVASDAAITLLVNNAGISLNGTLLDNPPAEILRLIALNVTAPTLLAAAAGKAFAARGHGGIINISSVLGVAPEISEATYGGSKAYLLNLSLTLANQVKDKGVRVQAVLPGATRSEIWERSGKDVNAFPPEMVMETADLVDAALAGYDKGEVVTIPPLADEAQWTAFDNARLALGPHLSRREVAPRYRSRVSA
jgi:short-subunit dehydrogenase